MANNPLNRLAALGQSVWLDYIHRDLFSSGELRALITQDSLTGMTSNPAIFEKAIAQSSAYDQEILELSGRGLDTVAVYEQLSQQDVGRAADEFRRVFDATQGQDGFVSLEVNPHLAHDTAGTVAEGRRLWASLNRPNVFIKVPGTRAGLGAIKQLISEGISINVTLLFSLQRYREVIDAYLDGLEARVAQGNPIKNVASVASFFISRIDALIDPMLDKLAAKGDARGAQAKSLRGEAAIASAKLAYQMHKHVFAHERFATLKAKGAQVQRLLWASTSTKDKSYSDVKYVEALIGPNTVDTMPMETVLAYRDHGNPQARLTEQLERAREVLETLPKLDIDIDAVTQQLEDEGVEKFNQPFDKLMQAVQSKQSGARAANDPGGRRQSQAQL
ncbi:MAG TPA: transaldolase [Steroidobacteraceae bacterium]|jgi:transaldolase|nr:transaldolase [Steroidobacteraceae bacterium]